MIRIILSDEQVQAARRTSDAVELYDQRGKLVGYLSRPENSDEIEQARRRINSDGPWFTTEQVLSHLESLEQG